MCCIHDTEQPKPGNANKVFCEKSECWIFWNKQVAETVGTQTNGSFNNEITQIVPISSAAVLFTFNWIKRK